MRPPDQFDFGSTSRERVSWSWSITRLRDCRSIPRRASWQERESPPRLKTWWRRGAASGSALVTAFPVRTLRCARSTVRLARAPSIQPANPCSRACDSCRPPCHRDALVRAPNAHHRGSRCNALTRTFAVFPPAVVHGRAITSYAPVSSVTRSPLRSCIGKTRSAGGFDGSGVLWGGVGTRGMLEVVCRRQQRLGGLALKSPMTRPESHARRKL